MTISAGAKAGEILGTERILRRVRLRDGRAGVLQLVPVDVAAGEEKAVAEQFQRRIHRGAVKHRIEQELCAGRRPTFGDSLLANDGRQIAAGAVAADRNLVRHGAELFGPRAGPPKRRDGVVDSRREGMFGGQAIVDREDVNVRMTANAAAQAIVGLDVAGHKAAAVVVDEQGPRSTGGRCIVTRTHDATAAVDQDIGDRADRHLSTGDRQSIVAQLQSHFCRYSIWPRFRT